MRKKYTHNIVANSKVLAKVWHSKETEYYNVSLNGMLIMSKSIKALTDIIKANYKVSVVAI